MVLGGSVSYHLDNEALGFPFALSPPTKNCLLCGWEFNRLFIYSPSYREIIPPLVRREREGVIEDPGEPKIAAVQLPSKSCSEIIPVHSRWTLQSSSKPPCYQRTVLPYKIQARQFPFWKMCWDICVQSWGFHGRIGQDHSSSVDMYVFWNDSRVIWLIQ